MLKITLCRKPKCSTFKLEGKLVGPWVRELEESWKALSEPCRKHVILDLTDVSFIDSEGSRLLSRLGEEGARFVANAPLTRAMVERAIGRHLRLSIAPLLALLVFAGLLRAQAPASARLTLRDAVQTALKQNPNIAIANLNVAQSEEDRAIARSGLLPQVGFQAADIVRRSNLEANLGKPIPFFPQHVGPYNVVQGGAGFSVPLFDLTLWRRFQASKSGVEGARAQEQGVREQYVALVVSQYLGSLRASADVNASRSRVDLAQALFKLASDVQKAGAGTRIDTLRAEVQLENERQRLMVAETELKTSVYALSRLLNLNPAQPVELTDAMSFFETPAFSAEESIDRAWQNRPEVRGLLARRRAVEFEKQGAGDARLPKLTIDGGWLEQGLKPSSAIPTYQYEATLQMPLFTGGRIAAERTRADQELRKTEQEERDLRARIGLEVKTAVAQLESARSEVEVSRRAFGLSEEEVAQARDRFRAGVANNIEVITAQDALARAADNRIVALYRYNQARADLARATGQMESLYAK